MNGFIDACKIFEFHDPAALEKEVNAFLENHDNKISILKREVILSSINRIAIMICYENVETEARERVKVLSHDNIDEVTNDSINSTIDDGKLKVVNILLDCHSPSDARFDVDVAMIFYIL
ncbi:MAG: hypothetical protein ACOYMB_01805 [Patescibacteria group bacterium]